MPGPEAAIDWSMGSRAGRIADWQTAALAARSVAGRGPSTSSQQRASLRADLSEAITRADDLVAEATLLVHGGGRSRADVMSRGAWVDANLRGLQRLLEPFVERLAPVAGSRSPVGRKALGGQLGLLLGYASRKVLGQYDPFLPADDEGLLYFIGPNVVEVERTTGVPPRDFRLWIALHEAAHRAQFGATPWLRAHLSGLVGSYLDSMTADPERVARQLREVAARVREGGDLRSIGPAALASGPQRDLLRRTQGLMSLLEGHATWTMNRVARGRVADLEAMRAAMRRRRRPSGIGAAVQRATGFDLKVRQYDAGERFVRTVVDRVGVEGLNVVWRSAAMLPDAREIAEPARWLARTT